MNPLLSLLDVFLAFHLLIEEAIASNLIKSLQFYLSNCLELLQRGFYPSVITDCTFDYFQVIAVLTTEAIALNLLGLMVVSLY
jgi:hypothetical protein